MNLLFERNVIQNPAIAAEAIWTATLACYEGNAQAQGLPFQSAFLVLPLVFHARTAGSLASKQKPAAMLKALAENREIPFGLQQRLVGFYDLTLRAISVGASSGLIALDSVSDRQLIPLEGKLAISHVDPEVKNILAASKRVGQAVAELEFSRLCSILSVQF